MSDGDRTPPWKEAQQPLPRFLNFRPIAVARSPISAIAELLLNELRTFWVGFVSAQTVELNRAP